MSNFFSRFTGAGESHRASRNPRHKSRKLQYEALEERQLLSVNPVPSEVWSEVTAKYSDLNWTEIGDYHYIEILAEELSEASLRDAFAQACTTTENDLIVVRTTVENNTVTLSGEQLEIHINAEEFGSVTIVSLGEERLTIDANEESRVFSMDEGADVGLAGLIITNGNDTDGGGIRNSGLLRVTDCVISENTANTNGGGIDNTYGTMTVSNCVISGNTALSGGGIYNAHDGTLTINDCVIDKNTARGHGGGTYNYDSTMTVTNSTLRENTGTNGGGIFNYEGTMAVTNCIVIKNGASSDSSGYYGRGGGVYSHGEMTVANCTIVENYGSRGGGIHNENDSTMMVTNSIIVENHASSGGGIYLNLGGTVTVTNCTISRNIGSMSGGGIYISSSACTVNLYNTIIVKNTNRLAQDANSNIQRNLSNPGTILGSNNLTTFEDWDEGSGENYLDDPDLPLFVNAEDSPFMVPMNKGDYRLAENSQAIDKGNNQYAFDAGLDENSLDMARKPRFNGDVIDIGAYEYFELSPAELVVSDVTKPQEAIAGTSIDVSWVIVNIGELAATESRTVEIYLTGTEPGMPDVILPLGTFEYLDAIDPDESIPFTELVTIPLGTTGTFYVWVEVIGENTTLAQSAETITIVAPSLDIAVDKNSLKEGIEDGVEFTITRTGDLSEDLVLTVTTSDASVLTVPETVTILAGECTITFYGSSILHENGGGDRLVTVTVGAENFADVTTTITVLDMLPAELVLESLVVPEQVVAGMQIDISWIIRNIGELPFDDDIWEFLYITDTGDLVDGYVLADFAQFRLIEGDSQMERSETITIPLHCVGDYQIIIEIAGHTSILVSNVFSVIAPEIPEINVTANISEIKEGVEDGVTFTVARTGDLSEDLVLTVTSSDMSKLTVPETVTIPAGESSVTFCGTSIRTNVREDDVPVTVTIAADAFETKSLEILVLDDTRIELVRTAIDAPMVARHGTTIDVSWQVTSSATFVTKPGEWVDNIYLIPLSSDWSMENAILVGSFAVDVQMDADESLDWTRSITIPEGLSGDYILIVQSTFGETQSELTCYPVIQLFIDTYTLRLTMPDQENVHWTISPTTFIYGVPEGVPTKEGVWVQVRDELGQLVFEDRLEYLNDIEITAAASHDSALTVDFWGGDYGMSNLLTFLGNPEQHNTLTLLGTDGDDVFFFNGSQGTVNGLSVAWSDIAYVYIDCGAGFDTVTIISSEFASAHFTVSDNLFVMDNGTLRVEIVNVDSIDAFGAGKHNSAYVYGENDSLIIMNDLFTERRNEAGIFRIWYCEQVTAVNADDTNNTVLHLGSRGQNVYMIAEGYGTATNAVGSYSHELIGFENIIISTPLSTPTISLPETENWRQEYDRSIWTQNGFTLMVLCNANVVKREGLESSAPTDNPDDVTDPGKHIKRFHRDPFDDDDFSRDFSRDFGHKHWDDDLCEFLADEHVRSQRKKDKRFGQDDETDDWLAEFEELALLDSMK